MDVPAGHADVEGEVAAELDRRLDLWRSGRVDADGEEAAATEQRHGHEERPLPTGDGEADAGGVARERQRHCRGEGDPLDRDDADAERRHGERVSRRHAGRQDGEVRRIGEPVLREDVADRLDELERTAELDTHALHVDVHPCAAGRAEPELVELHGDDAGEDEVETRQPAVDERCGVTTPCRCPGHDRERQCRAVAQLDGEDAGGEALDRRLPGVERLGLRRGRPGGAAPGRAAGSRARPPRQQRGRVGGLGGDDGGRIGHGATAPMSCLSSRAPNSFAVGRNVAGSNVPVATLAMSATGPSAFDSACTVNDGAATPPERSAAAVAAGPPTAANRCDGLPAPNPCWR